MHSSPMTSEGQQRARRVGDTHTQPCEHHAQVTVTQPSRVSASPGRLNMLLVQSGGRGGGEGVNLAARMALCTQAEWNANRIQFSRSSRASTRAARPEHKYHCESTQHAERDVHARKDNECSQRPTRRAISQSSNRQRQKRVQNLPACVGYSVELRRHV